MAQSVILFGASWCPFCQSAKGWLDRNKIEYEYRDADEDGVRDEMKTYVPDNETIPVVVIDGKGYVNPEHSFLASELGVEANVDQRVHDVVSIGAGPAALAAAIYTTREDLDTVLVAD
jgi:thioredoxin reductase (NADPH)